MASRRSEQQENARLRVMRLLNDHPTISTRAVAKAVGISNGSAFYVLKALINKGFVKLENFSNNPAKKQYTYLLTRKGIQEKSDLTYRFIVRKRKEYENLKLEIESLEEELDLTKFTQNKF